MLWYCIYLLIKYIGSITVFTVTIKHRRCVTLLTVTIKYRLYLTLLTVTIKYRLNVTVFTGRVLDSRPKGGGFEPHRRHCVVSLSKNINPSLVLVQPRKTCPIITERLLMGRKETNQTKQIKTVFTVTINIL